MARSEKKRRSSASEEPSWWRRRSSWVQHGICLAVLLAVSVTFFAPVHFSGKSLAGGDSVNWRGMAQSMIEHQGATGEQALWATNLFAGMPGYMVQYPNEIPQLDTVLSFLRQYFWPTSHFFFLLAGTYGLVFFLTRNKGAGLLAACAYGLTTYIPIILVTGHNTKFIALSLAPWMAWAFAYALRRLRLLAALFFAAALALNLRAGHVQITYYLTFLLGIWWVVEGIGALRTGRLRAFGKATGFLALGSVLGLMMVAQPYLANAEYKRLSTRGAPTVEGTESGLEEGYAMRWSQGPGELVTLAVAGAYGGSSREGTYWGPKPFTEGPHYVGLIVLLLAGLACWQVRRNAVYAFGIGALLMTLLALGRHLSFFNDLAFAYLPLYDSFRAPETWMSVVAFALAVLAGIGVDAAGRRFSSDDKDRALSRSVYGAVGVAGAFALVLLVGKGVLFDFEKENERAQVRQQVVRQVRARVAQQPGLTMSDPRVQQAVSQNVRGYMQRVKPQRREAFSSDLWRTLIFLVLGAAALVLYRRETIGRATMIAALIVLVAADLGAVGRRYLNEDRLSPVSLEQQIPKYATDRYILQQREEAGGPGHFRVLSFQGNNPRAMSNPMNSSRPSYFYESIGGYHAAKLQRYQDFIDYVLTDPGTNQIAPRRINENALDLLNTRYVVAPRRVEGLMPVGRDSTTGFIVLENPDAVPRGFFVGRTEVVASARQMFERLRSPRFDPRRTALLSEPLEDFETTPLDSAGTASVELQSYGPREIVWQVQTGAPRLLVASEVYYPAGWNAYIDGEGVPIHRADYLLRAVPVPEGQHRLVMRFEPTSHTRGVWMAGVSTVFVYGVGLFLLGRLLWRRRKRGEKEPEEAPPET